MIPSPPTRWSAELSAERSAPRASTCHFANGSFKVRRWPEGDRTAGAMASIAPGAASPYPTGIPHPSEPPTSSQPERWRLPWRRRQCQPSTGIRGFGEVRGPITCPDHTKRRIPLMTRRSLRFLNRRARDGPCQPAVLKSACPGRPVPACAFLARVLRIARASLDRVLSKTAAASLRSYSKGS